MNLQQLIELGDNLELASRALQCPLEEVHKLQTPCILHWDMNHFVVLTKVSGKGAKAKFAINDPAVGKRSLNSDDITHMTMGYNSLVGDMGSNLSGGQVQRLLLARALYQSPCVLFMDEATSHLDKDNEAKISEQIQLLPITRIMIAHRQETINMAGNVYKLQAGSLNTTEIERDTA